MPWGEIRLENLGRMRPTTLGCEERSSDGVPRQFGVPAVGESAASDEMDETGLAIAHAVAGTVRRVRKHHGTGSVREHDVRHDLFAAPGIPDWPHN